MPGQFEVEVPDDLFYDIMDKKVKKVETPLTRRNLRLLGSLACELSDNEVLLMEAPTKALFHTKRHRLELTLELRAAYVDKSDRFNVILRLIIK